MDGLRERLAEQRMNPSAPAETPASPAPETPPVENQPPEGEPAAPAETETPPAEEPQPEEQPPTEPTAEALAEVTDFEELKALVPQDKRELVTRVHELLGDRKTARDENVVLKQQLQERDQAIQQLREGSLQTATVPHLTAIDRHSGHPAVKDVDARLGAVDDTIAWCDANPEGGEVTGKDGKTHTFNATEVKAMQRQAEKDRPSLLVDRAGKVNKLVEAENARRSSADAIAQKVYPWITKETSPEFQVALQIGREVPGLLQSPEMTLFLGDAVRGRLAREADARRAKAAPLKRAAAPPNVTTTAAAAPRVTDPGAAEVKTAEENYRRTGKLAELLVLNKARSRQRAAQQSKAA